MNTSPIKAIRAYCLSCCCESAYEVKLCPSKKCALYEFRFGKNPFHRQKLTEAQRIERAERMRRIIKNGQGA